MKVRNNTNGDFSLVFTDGHSINFSRAEISRELTDEESTDAKFIKHLSPKYKHIIIYKEPVKKDKEEEPKKTEEKEEKGTVIIKKEDIKDEEEIKETEPKGRERRTVRREKTPKAKKED